MAEEVAIKEGFHPASVRRDRNILLGPAGEDLNQKVWEIQIEGEEIILFILGKEEERVVDSKAGRITILKLQDSPLFLGLFSLHPSEKVSLSSASFIRNLKIFKIPFDKPPKK